MSISEDARKRFVEATGIEPEPNMKSIPDDITGLGYQWYPLIIASNSKDNLDAAMKQIKYAIRPCINTFRGSDMTKEASYPEADIVAEVLRDSVNVGCRPMGYDLGIAPRFIDPKEITDAIQTVKTMPNSHYIGFMPAFDVLEFKIENETFYFHQENCMREGTIKTKSWEISPELQPRQGKDGRIFNWLLRIDVKPRVKKDKNKNKR
ncbi:Hypothetical protein HVR_LOCUS495 [uncultured virus]|nr:Hypothetical protein HVR_LOCUS495 [uncultured virus]